MRIPSSPCNVVLLSLFLIGCTATGPADDGWETSEGFKEGDGLFSKSKGAYQFSIGNNNDKQNEDKKQAQKEEDKQVKHNSQATIPTSTDYETYLRWHDAKDKNSEEYQRFLKWQEFENYLRWQQSQ